MNRTIIRIGQTITHIKKTWTAKRRDLVECLIYLCVYMYIYICMFFDI